MTSPTWKAAAYPVTTTCPFCGSTLTIALRGDGPTTSTSGHAHDCIQNPNRTRWHASKPAQLGDPVTPAPDIEDIVA